MIDYDIPLIFGIKFTMITKVNYLLRMYHVHTVHTYIRMYLYVQYVCMYVCMYVSYVLICAVD